MLESKKRFNLQYFAEGDPPQDPPKDPPADPPADPTKVFDEAYVKQLRDEAAANRVKAKQLEEQAKTAAQEATAKIFKALGIEADPNKNYEGQLAEAQKKAQEAEARASEMLVKAEVKSIATEMGLVDADAALALMDRANVKVTEAGDVTGVKESLEALVKVKTWLKAEGTPGGVGGGTNPPPGDPGENFLSYDIKRSGHYHSSLSRWCGLA
jgi:ethanolamine utilization microcompartment shell protein EutS